MRFFVCSLIALLLPLAACIPPQPLLGEKSELIEYGNVEVNVKIESVLIKGTGPNATATAFEIDKHVILGEDSSRSLLSYISSTARYTTAVNGVPPAGSVQDVLLKGAFLMPVESNSTDVGDNVYISNAERLLMFSMRKTGLSCDLYPSRSSQGGFRVEGIPADYYIYKGRLVRLYKDANSTLFSAFYKDHGLSFDEQQTMFLVDALTNDLVATARIGKAMLGGKQVMTITLMHVNLFKSKLVLDETYSKYFAPPPALISKCRESNIILYEHRH